MDQSMGSVTQWLAGLGDGDEQAVAVLFVRYWAPLVLQARNKLCAARARTTVSNEEDIASAVFARLAERVRAGRFPRLENRQDLWQVLLMLTACEVVDGVRSQRRAKRGGGREIPRADATPHDASTISDIFNSFIGSAPSPEQAAIMAEDYEARIAALPDDRLRQIARLKFEGFTNQEIAERIGRSLRSVVSSLTLIRKTLEQAEEA